MPDSSYDIIADEYYDVRHVTSRNFDDTTKIALRDRPFPCEGGLVLEVGAGRGRATEYLGVDGSRLIQLDSSEKMLSLPSREGCLLKMVADACAVPLASKQFTFVVGFLVDPFFGLDCLGEAFRVLKDDGQILLTVPTKQWGDTLRASLKIDPRTTRFRLVDGEKSVVLPSVLHSPGQILDMLDVSGFRCCDVTSHCLPPGLQGVSPDISSVAGVLGVSVSELEVLHLIRARR